MVLTAAWASAAFGNEARTSSERLAIYGTEPRQETSFQIAFPLKRHMRSDQFAHRIKERLDHLIANGELAFPRLTGSPYFVDSAFQAVAYRDVYLDTADFDVLKSRSAYRLRYSWDRNEVFQRYRLFPFSKAFFPQGLEIQFKGPYDLDPEREVVKVQESRFAFRNDVPPFVSQQNAPPSPWPVEEYVRYAAKGVYSKYRLRPTVELAKRLKQSGARSLTLEPVLEVSTVRNRIYLTSRHPWGETDVPLRTFIVTIDMSTLNDSSLSSALRPENAGPALLEIEVEIAPSTSEPMERLVKIAGLTSGETGGIVDAAIDTTRRALAALHRDLEILRREVLAALAEKTKPLPLDFSYSALMRRARGDST